jgi:hypothetical protein
MLYEMAAGRHPFAGLDAAGLARAHATAAPEPLARAAPHVSPFFADFVHALLVKSPDARVATAEEAADALERRRSSRWWRRRPARSAVGRPQPRTSSGAATGMGESRTFVGRTRELRRLGVRFRAAAARHGGAVLVEGPGGTGKSRLVAQFVDGVRRSAPDALVLTGSHAPGSQHSATWPWVAALRGGIAPARLRSAVRRALRAAPAVARAFEALLEGRPAPDGAPLPQAAIESAVARTIAVLAARTPVVIVVEDLHFGPPDARRLLGAIGAEVASRRALIVATSRSSPDSKAATDRDVERLALPSLDRDETRRMLVAALGDDAAAQSTIESVWLTSQGNPFAINEILRDLRDRNVLRRTARGGWTLRSGAGAVSVPPRLKSVLGSRLARLRDEDLELLRIGAVAGPSFDADLVGEISGRGAGRTRRRLAYLAVRTGLIRPADGGFEFDHHLVLEAVLASTRPAVRRRIHSAAADTIAKRLGVATPAETGELQILLCEHLIAAGRTDSVQELLPVARRTIYLRPQPYRYRSLVTAALAVPGAISGSFRVDSLLDLAELRGVLGEPMSVVISTLRSAMALAGTLGERGLECRAALRLAHFLSGLRDVDDARRNLRRARRLARTLGNPDLRTRSFLQAADVAVALDRDQRILRRSRAAVEASRRGGDRRIRGIAVLFLYEFALRLDDLETARGADAAVTELDAENEPVLRPRCHALAAALAVAEARWPDADEAADAGVEATQRRPDRLFELMCIVRKSVALSAMGRPREAYRWAARGAALAQDMGEGHLDPEVDVAFGAADRADGRLATAAERFQRAEERFVSYRFRNRSAEAATLRASVLVTLGRLDEAEAIGSRVELASAGALRGSRVALLRASVAIARADRDAAVAARTRAAEIARSARLDVAEAKAHLELAALGAGDAESCASRLRAVRELAAATGDAAVEATTLAVEAARGIRDPADAARGIARLTPRLDWETRLRVEWLLWTSGAGVAHLEAAARALRRLVRHAPLADRRAMVERVALHRAVRAAAASQLRARDARAPGSPELAASA